FIQDYAAKALRQIVDLLQTQVRYLPDKLLEDAIASLQKAQKRLTTMQIDDQVLDLNSGKHPRLINPVEYPIMIRGTLAVLQQEQERRHRIRLLKWLQAHLCAVIIFGGFLAFWAGSGLLLAFWPLTLFSLNERLSWLLGLRQVLGFGCWHYHPRVLDAWV